MQVVVNKSDLISGNDSIYVSVMYGDNVDVNLADQPPGSIVLSVSPSAVERLPIGGRLVKTWRETEKSTIVFTEAKRRIEEIFPEYSQRNANHELESYVLSYGSEPTKWPANVRARKDEIDRCWNYVDAVRAKSNNLVGAALAADPTADGNWPTRIAPYVPGK